MPRTALLVNFVAPYRLPVFEALQARVGRLRIFASTLMEPNRAWPVDWGSLDVQPQRTLTLRKRWRDASGFADVGYVHFPYDTYAQLRRFAPDAIISSELGLRTALAVLYKRRYPRVRLVVWATVSEHTERSRGTLRGLIRPRLLKYADAVLVNGASGSRYVSSLGVSPDRVVRVPYTADVDAFAEYRAPDGNPDVVRLLYVGLLIERKGLLPFLDVLTRWARNNPERRIQLTMVGDGPMKTALQRAAVPTNLTLDLRDSVPYRQLPPLYASADIFVLPTLADEWGVVVNEAMAARLPVLGSRHSQAVEELVNDGETGWIFNPDDERSVYGTLDRALGSTRDVWRRMGDAASRCGRQLTPEFAADCIAKALCPDSVQSA